MKDTAPPLTFKIVNTPLRPELARAPIQRRENVVSMADARKGRTPDT